MKDDKIKINRDGSISTPDYISEIIKKNESGYHSGTTNQTSCSGKNATSCTNNGDCSNTINQNVCSNTGTCFNDPF